MKFIFPGWLYLKIIQDDAKVLNPRSGSKSHNVDKVWSNWWCLIYGKYLSQVVLPTSSLLVFFCVDDVILRAILGVSWPPFAPEFRCLLFTGQPPLPAGYLRWSHTVFSVLFMTSNSINWIKHTEGTYTLEIFFLTSSMIFFTPQWHSMRNYL